MTPAHAFFIPSIFFLGLFFGALIARKAGPVTHARADAHPARRASGWGLGIAFLVFVGTFVATHMLALLGGVKALHHVLNGQPIFDQRPSFASADVYARLEAFGAPGRAMYQQFTYTADLLFPLSLLAFLAVLARFVLDRSAVRGALRTVLLVLPGLWFCSDMLENTMVYHLIAQYPLQHPWLAGTLGLVTTVKFSLLLLALVVPAVCSVWLRQRTAALA